MIYVNKRGWRADLSWVKKLGKIIRRQFKVEKDVSLALVSDKEIRSLNKVYRRHNKVTDVLSFAWQDKNFLGEVVICPTQAKRQAIQQQHSLSKELKILTIHGILHLLGFDHERNKAQFKKQSDWEAKILKLLN
ncbi:MAG: rRNA maturation RNase YbeY [Patescibacteria group bacterium]